MTWKGWVRWTAWLLSVAATFALLEGHGWASSDTLSRYITTISAHWPLFIYLFGLTNGILAAHFFWPWKKNPLGKGGG